MEIGKLLFTQPVSQPSILEKIKTSQPVDDDKKIKFSKDFESVFINKLLDEMKNTVGNWDEDEEDGTSEQMNGIFYMQLGDDIGQKGGLGMWKDIKKSLDELEKKNEEHPILNKSV
jgi:Rod binding domain-containing protein